MFTSAFKRYFNRFSFFVGHSAHGFILRNDILSKGIMFIGHYVLDLQPDMIRCYRDSLTLLKWVRLSPVYSVTDVDVCCRCMSFLSGTLYRLVYDDCYTNQYAVLRAAKSFGEKKYDIFEQNCEHSTMWCKTGIHDSRQMEVCFTTAGKAALIVCLRMITLLILWMLQLSWESQPVTERLIQQERILNAVYMSFIACLFLVYSLYKSCSWIAPVVPEKPHNTDVCGIESGRRRCADATYKCCCCCGIPRCDAIVMGLCCASCFFCSLFDACRSACDKNIQCGPRTICRRPSSVVIGLFIRIFIREMIAAAGPLLVLYYEEEITINVTTKLNQSIVIILTIIAASIVAYLIGALIGVLVEAMFRCCANCCCGRSTVTYNTGENAQPAREEIRLMITGNSSD